MSDQPTVRASLEALYAPADHDQRPDSERIEYMAEQLTAAGLDLESATVDQLNRLARGEPLPITHENGPEATPASKDFGTGHPTSSNQEGTISMDYGDEFTKYKAEGSVDYPGSLADLASRPNTTVQNDLEGNPELYERRIVDQTGVCVEEWFAAKSGDGPADLSYAMDMRVDGYSLAQLRGCLTTILRLLPPDESKYLGYLTAGDE